MGHDMLQDIGSDTIDFVGNFDDSLEEPAILPSAIPNLLVNGSSGIAVGMSTSIPPHNLGEVIDALGFMIDHWSGIEDITIADLMRIIRGPDFPTGGLVFRYKGDSGQSQIDALANAYATGRGRVIVRAKAHVEHMERKKSRIVITELPYQINKPNLMSRIADLHRDGKIEGLTDLRDESDRNGMRIILETTRNVEPEEVLAQLFRLTPMQTTFSIIMVALVKGEPRVLTLKQALRFYLEHRISVIRRRSEYELAQAVERAHILEGLLKALDHIDDVIETIRRSRNVESARSNLIRSFRLTELQAQAILDMRLRRLAALERRKLQEEYKEKKKLIGNLEKLLAKPDLLRLAVKEELFTIRERYRDARRTQIVGESSDSADISASDLLPDELVWVLIGDQGTVARTSSSEMIKMQAKPREAPFYLLQANTQDILYLFAADGQAVSLPVYQLPQTQEMGEGVHWSSLTGVSKRQYLSTACVIPPDADGFLTLGTLGGTVKRVRLIDLPGITGTPFVAINVSEDDSLGWARITSGEDDIILVTAAGQAIRFREKTVRPMGLPAGGVFGIKLAHEADGVVVMDIAQPEGYLWSITDSGLAKATPMSAYPTQGRHGQGVINVRLPKDASEVVSAVVGSSKSTVYVITAAGSARRMQIERAATGNRPIKPKPVVRLGQRNRVTGAVIMRHRQMANQEFEE
jgi:DNA gyrase subunit A